MLARALALFALLALGCDGPGAASDGGPRPDAYVLPPPATCTPGAEPQASVAAPAMIASLGDRWHEGWLGSPAVADLDGDGTREIIAARAGMLIAWHLDGEVVFRVEVDGRIWASPIVADLTADPPVVRAR